jgi:hypothetical protein
LRTLVSDEPGFNAQSEATQIGIYKWARLLAVVTGIVCVELAILGNTATFLAVVGTVKEVAPVRHFEWTVKYEISKDGVWSREKRWIDLQVQICVTLLNVGRGKSL